MKLPRAARNLVVLVAALVVLIAVAVLTGVGDDDENTEAEWCAAADEIFTEVIAIRADQPTVDEPEEFIPLERAADTFRETTAPEAIREDVAIAYSAERFSWPRGDQRPYITAEVAVYGWMLDNCTLSDHVREELSADQGENVEFLDGG